MRMHHHIICIIIGRRREEGDNIPGKSTFIPWGTKLMALDVCVK
jgi:hypothetical protein